MSGGSPRSPSDPGRSSDWDEAPTEIRLPPPGLSSTGSFDFEADQTAEYPVMSQREPHTDALLPDFVEASLEIVSGPDPRGTIDLKLAHTLIGRGAGGGVRMQDMMMSKKHASILYTDGEFRIRDEKSSNGTFLNGSKVVEYAIRDGDKLLIGDTLFRFRLVRK